jgi:hypothetical protein
MPDHVLKSTERVLSSHGHASLCQSWRNHDKVESIIDEHLDSARTFLCYDAALPAC